MTHRYAHRRVATLFRTVQATAAARVLDWPQWVHAERRPRVAITAKAPRDPAGAAK